MHNEKNGKQCFFREKVNENDLENYFSKNGNIVEPIHKANITKKETIHY